MVNRGRFAGAGVVIAIVGVLTACTDLQTLSGSANPTGSSGLTQQAPASAGSSNAAPGGSSPRNDQAQTAFDAGVAKTSGQPWSSYEWVTQTTMGTGELSVIRVVDTDLTHGVERIHVTMDGTGEAKRDGMPLVSKMIVTKKAQYLNMPAWTDAHRGKWMKFTPEDFQQHGLADGTSVEIAALPSGVEEFAPTTIDGNVVEGFVGAAVGVRLLGMPKLLQDPELRDSLSGRVPVTITLNPTTGAISHIAIHGEGAELSWSSTKYPSDQVNLMLQHSTGAVTFHESDQVPIALPPTSLIVPG